MKTIARRATFIGCFLISITSTQAFAEKYFTWVDEMGRVNHTLIPEEENPLIKPEKPEKTEASLESHAKDNEVSELRQPEKPTNTSKTEAERVEPADKVAAKGNIGAEKEQPVGSLGVAVGASAGSIPKETPSSTISRPTTKGQAVPSELPVARKVEINEEDYIDGDLLLEQGNIRDENDLPYYTWTDEQGIVRNTPYRPTGPSTSAKGSKVKNTKKPVVYSVYDEYRRTIQPVNTQLASTQKVDGFAQKLFFQDSADSFIETFESACCVDLPKESPSVLGFEDSVYVEFDRDAEAYLFSEGKSPYKLIELPHVKNTYSLKLKTFVKSSSKTGVKNGVFFPQIIFLDESYEVLRIIRNPVLEYVPENWRRHGYLKGLFKIDGRDKERFMLINTTKESLRARNSIESSKVILLNNQVTGSFELEALKN